jgi:hypothetical protein
MSAENSELIKVVNAKRNRRSALRSLGLGALGVGTMGLLASKAKADGQEDKAILNFLESLRTRAANFKTRRF